MRQEKKHRLQQVSDHALSILPFQALPVLSARLLRHRQAVPEQAHVLQSKRNVLDGDAQRHPPLPLLGPMPQVDEAHVCQRAAGCCGL